MATVTWRDACRVWSKHFAHGLKLEDLPRNLDKPLVVGESGATYYGRPIQLYPFVGEKAFLSYEGRSEALAIDVYQNARQMALPYLSYYSPSEVCWFGLEHMNLGYHDFNRLPNLTDGILPGNLMKRENRAISMNAYHLTSRLSIRV